MRSRIADLGWLAFHLVALVATHGFGLWLPYWCVFLFVELVGLVQGFPMTWTVRGFLHTAEPGAAGRWRFGLVLLWSFWLAGTFGIYAPLPLLVKGPIMIGFYVWLGRHFFDEVRTRRAA